MRLLSVLGRAGPWATACSGGSGPLARHRPALGWTPPRRVPRSGPACSRPSSHPAAERATSVLPDAEAVDRLRVEYRRLLLPARRPRLWPTGWGWTTPRRSFADLAAGDARGCAGHRRRPASAGRRGRLAVIAMGKCGGARAQLRQRRRRHLRGGATPRRARRAQRSGSRTSSHRN